MSRINTNISSIIAQNRLSQSNADLNVRLERLSTGLQINRGADDPAGLIVSERLRSEISGVGQAIDNAERAINVIATAEGSLTEVSSLLTDIKGLILEASNTGGVSKDEIEANQLQIDSAIESVSRISNSASFAGLKLLNGSLDYLVSGNNPTQIQDVRVFGANFGTNTSIPVEVEVVNSAESGQLFISGNLGPVPGTFTSSVTIEVQGALGVEALSFISGATLSAVAAGINQVTDITGVSASLASATDQTSGLVLTSTAVGSEGFVSVRKLQDGTFFQTYEQQGGLAVNRDEGQDVLALINGSLALGDGTSVSLRTSTLNLEVNLTTLAAQSASTYSFDITGGGTSFQIGPDINAIQHVGFGIQSTVASNLGNQALGFLNSIVAGGDNSLLENNRFSQALSIVDESIDQIATLRGRLGAFERNTLQTTIRSQQITLENLTAAESQIRDTDFAAETAALTRAQILVNAGTSTLAIANSTAQSVLSLLG